MKKIYAYHDSEGTIRSLISVDEGLEQYDVTDLEGLGAIAKSHKISTPLPRCKVVRKR